MEFKRFFVGEDESTLERFLREKKISCIDWWQVKKFKQGEQQREVDCRKRIWKFKHPFRHFWATRGEGSWFLVIFPIALGITMLDHKYGLPTLPAILCFAVGLGLTGMFIKGSSWGNQLNHETPWLESTLSQFGGEYSGEEFLKLTAELLLKEGKNSGLKVQYHPISNYRFLVLYDPDNIDEEYYVDYWQKSAVAEQ